VAKQWGLMGLASVAVVEDFSLGLRGEFTSKTGGAYRQLQVTGGASYKILDPVTLRGGYSLSRSKSASNVGFETNHRFDASLVYRF
jgi:opacity protein-like surface antigen